MDCRMARIELEEKIRPNKEKSSGGDWSTVQTHGRLYFV
jgi:hypothetical protein